MWRCLATAAAAKGAYDIARRAYAECGDEASASAILHAASKGQVRSSPVSAQLAVEQPENVQATSELVLPQDTAVLTVERALLSAPERVGPDLIAAGLLDNALTAAVSSGAWAWAIAAATAAEVPFHKIAQLHLRVSLCIENSDESSTAMQISYI